MSSIDLVSLPLCGREERSTIKPAKVYGLGAKMQIVRGQVDYRDRFQPSKTDRIVDLGRRCIRCNNQEICLLEIASVATLAHV